MVRFKFLFFWQKKKVDGPLAIYAWVSYCNFLFFWSHWTFQIIMFCLSSKPSILFLVFSPPLLHLCRLLRSSSTFLAINILHGHVVYVPNDNLLESFNGEHETQLERGWSIHCYTLRQSMCCKFGRNQIGPRCTPPSPHKSGVLVIFCLPYAT